MKWIITTIIILSAIGCIYSHPAPVSALQYEPGVEYRYSYDFTILLNEDSNLTSRSASIGRHVGYKVSSDVLLTNIWQNAEDIKDKLLRLELMKPKLLVSSTLHNMDGETQHWSKLENLSYPPIYIHWNNGLVKTVYLLPDVESMINIKKGLASLLQMQLKEVEVQELDVSGLCKVKYKRSGMNLKKTKYECQHTLDKEPRFNSSHLRSTTSSVFSELFYTLTPEAIREVVGTEEVMIKLNLWSQAAMFVKSKMKLYLVEQQADKPLVQASSLSSALIAVSQELGLPLKEDSLEVMPKGYYCVDNCKPLSVLVKENANYLQPANIGKMKSASGFLRVLDGFRRASKKELLMVFKDSKEQLLAQMLDVLAASQTEDSLDVAFELLDFGTDDIAIPERFLHCLAVVPHPSETVVRKTLKLTQKKIKNKKLHATVLITLSSLLKKYCTNNLDKANSKIVNTAVEFILKGLGCDDPQCLLLQLYAIKNAAHPNFIPFLLKHASAGGNTGRVSLEALKEIGVEHFTPEVILLLQRIYNEFWPSQDSTTRVLAAELLMNAKPTVEVIQNLLNSLSEREHHEVNTLVLAVLVDAAAKNPSVKSTLEFVLQNTSFGNYNTLAQNGSSTFYTKLLQAAHDVNVTYAINLEMRKTGMLKRTSMDLKVSNKEEELPLLSLGLSVSGFGLTDEELKAMDVPEENSAGMEMSVLGVHLRPYTFFTGTAELMGLVWSGVGSELMPALQANVLLMDEKKSVVLQNGLAVDFVLKAAMSADVSGTIEVSMWNKNAQAVVKNTAALLVRGFGRVDTSFVESHVDFGLGGNTILDMNVDLDFSSKPMKMCLQVEQPAFHFRHNIRKTETIPGSKHLIKTLKRRSIYFPAKSLALHQNNYKTCQEMLNPQPKTSFW